MAGPARGLWLGALALTACGPLVDDPANPPLRGRWQRELKVTSLIADDVWIPRKDAPFKLPEDETTVKSCIEPKLRSADEINGDMLANNDAHCRIDAIDVNGAQVTGAGTCAPVDRNGIHLSGKIDIDGRQRDDRINAKFGLALIARMPQGVSRRVRAGMEVTWTRLGDCRL